MGIQITSVKKKIYWCCWHCKNRLSTWMPKRASTRVPIPLYYYLAFNGLLHHRGVGYTYSNLRRHAFFDFVGYTRIQNKVYNIKYTRRPRSLKRSSRVLPVRKQKQARIEAE